MSDVIMQYNHEFQSTHPVWVGTSGGTSARKITTDFNPPTPCGVGPLIVNVYNSGDVFQSTHPVWGGTALGFDKPRYVGISIHPPRVGWDD